MFSVYNFKCKLYFACLIKKSNLRPSKIFWWDKLTTLQTNPGVLKQGVFLGAQNLEKEGNKSVFAFQIILLFWCFTSYF